MPDVYVAPPALDEKLLAATRASFGHPNALAHSCEHCRELRRTGPKDDRCSLGRHQGTSIAAESESATELIQALLPRREQRKRARQRFRRALRGEFTRSTKARA